MRKFYENRQMLDAETSVTTDVSKSLVATDEIKDKSAITIADLQKTDNQILIRQSQLSNHKNIKLTFFTQ